MALFLKQNLELLIGKYGIDSSKGRAITAGLFPNPTLTINSLTSYTQGCDLARCGAIMGVLSQLFEVAGKRGFRIESARYGTKSSEAIFEDTVLQLRFAVKDAYFRVQVGRQHLIVDKKTFDRIEGIIGGKTARPMQGIDERDKIWFRIQFVEAQAQVIHDVQDIAAATADLQVLLGLNPEVELELTTPLEYHRVDPHGPQLHQLAVSRPDIQAKRLLFSRRKAELRLARSISVPNVSVDLGYLVQGPQGPDNQQQWTLNVGFPLPIFDKNQGGIMVANADLMAAQTDLQKTLNDLRVEVDTAYRRMIESRRLVEVYQGGVLEDAKRLLRFAEKAYSEEKGSISELLNAGQTVSDLFENYLEALFAYQRDVLLLESAVGQDLQ
jgi:cobalt-zinc-cadmium efflux system outer membrane protein